MARVVFLILLALLVIYCLVEVAQADAARVRLMPKWLWAAAVICFPGIGGLAWLIFGRPVGPVHPTTPPPPRPKGPDDDPEFLRKLGRK